MRICCLVLMQSYPARALDRKLQVDWAREAREGPKWRLLSLSLSPFRCHSSSKKQRNPLMKKILGLQAPMELASCGIRASSSSFNHSFFYLFFKPPTRKNHNLGTNMSLHSSSSVNGEGSTPKDPLYKILDELRSLKLWKEKQERKEKGKKRVEEISQDERKKIREEERRKIMKEMKREKHVSYSSHNSCKSLSEELRDYYEGKHRSHLRPHSHRRENERKPQEVNIKLPYFHGKDNEEAYLDWEIRVEQKLKRKPTLKSYGYHSYPKKDQGLGILGAAPSKPNDDKGKTIEKQPPKASMQEKTSSIKCFKCLGRGHITSQCSTKKTMIMRSQDIYSSQDEATTSPSSSQIHFKGEGMMQSYPARALDRKLQVDWAREAREGPKTHLLLEVASPLSLPFSIPLPFIFQEAKESIDEEDPRPTSSNGACITFTTIKMVFYDAVLENPKFSSSLYLFVCASIAMEIPIEFFTAGSYHLSLSNMASTSSLSGMSTKPSFKPSSPHTCLHCPKKLQTNAQLISCKTVVVLKLIGGLNRNPFPFGFSSVVLSLLTTLHFQSFKLEHRDMAELLHGSSNLNKVERLPKLVRATIAIGHVLLEVVNNVKFLCIDWDKEEAGLIPEFQNLIHLELGYSDYTGDWVEGLEVIKGCPNLQILNIDMGSINMDARGNEGADWPFPRSKHWLANNTLGLAFCIQGIEMLSLGSFKTGAILLEFYYVGCGLYERMNDYCSINVIFMKVKWRVLMAVANDGASCAHPILMEQISRIIQINGR
ncbi:Signal peptide peptidase [Glycine soja]